MSIPTATYRIQFRNGMTFDRAAQLVPYLQQLGISHLYASPIFTATRDSTHGYDVTDTNEIDPAIGGRAGRAVDLPRLTPPSRQAAVFWTRGSSPIPVPPPSLATTLSSCALSFGSSCLAAFLDFNNL